MRVFISLLVLVCTIVGSPVLARDADGSAKIRLLGAIADNAKSRVTVAEIEAIGTAEIDAYNPYEKKADLYTGVWMRDFAAHFGDPGVTTITMTAIDDYEITFEKAEWDALRILIATKVNGSYMRLENKGPMRIIFPDYDPKLEAYQVNLPKWMWMIKRIEFN
ncbi:MAG: hypothetical protein NXI16_00035 [Alphaproteobacteria bacterium]|nr:hypothetical protein [Alphaproteobacteria bacterium]